VATMAVKITTLLAAALLVATLCTPAAALAARVSMPLSRQSCFVRQHAFMADEAAEAEANPAKVPKAPRVVKPAVPTMNKSDLVSRIATRTGVTKKVANDVLSATMETIVDSVCEGNKVMLVGFGSFTPKSLPAREGRNPRTGEKLQIQGTRFRFEFSFSFSRSSVLSF